jgi:hypothetical protein
MKLLMESWRKYLKESKQLPELLYHGTTETFDAFDINKAGRRDSGNMGKGVYLSTDSDIAMSYAEENAKRFDGDPVVLEVEHNLDNVADFNDHVSELIQMGVTFPPKANDPERSAVLTEYFTEKEFDAAHAGHEVVVFEPNKLNIRGVGDISSTEEAFKAKARAQADKLGIPYEDLGL